MIYVKILQIGLLYIVVRHFNELTGQLVLLLQRGVGQGGVDGVLGQVRTLFAVKGGIDILTRTQEGGAYIVHGYIDLVHLVKHFCILRDGSGHLVGHVHQHTELLGARLHYRIGGDDTILISRVVQDELFHVGDALGGSLAGETGRLADVTTGIVGIQRPAEEVGQDQARGAYGYYGAQDDDTFFAFHGNYDFKLFYVADAKLA